MSEFDEHREICKFLENKNFAYYSFPGKLIIGTINISYGEIRIDNIDTNGLYGFLNNLMCVKEHNLVLYNELFEKFPEYII